MAITKADVHEILTLIENSSLQYIHLELEGTIIEVNRHAMPASTSDSRRCQTILPPAQTASAEAPPARRSGEDLASTPHTRIEAPMTGTFYTTPSPRDPPFVRSGDAVEEGQTIGIIEVMKLFTQIRSPCSGVVRYVAPRNGELVEFGDVLFLVEAGAR